MGNLIDIQNQIEKLQKQAAEIKTREFRKTVQDIVAQMQAFGISLKDVQQAMAKPRGGRGQSKAKAKTVPRKAVAKRVSKQAGKTVAPKFRGPNGETWSGRGLMPKWLSALVAQGKSKESFAVKG